MAYFETINSEGLKDFLLSARFQAEKEGASSGIRAFAKAPFQAELLKCNPKRKVFRLSDGNGKEFYLKIFRPEGWFGRVFRNHAKMEYRASELLERKGIPVVTYLARGCSGGISFNLSKGVPGAVSGRRFCFDFARAPGEARIFFLTEISLLAASLCKAGILHKDFHSGNIIFDPGENRFLLVDPCGVAEMFFESRGILSLCGIWMELREFLTKEELLEGVLSGGLAKNKLDALDILEKAGKLHSERELRQRPKLEKRILSGTSKFATLKTDASVRYYWRHDDCFRPPERFEIRPEWKRREFKDSGEALKLYLDSFFHLCKEPPALLILHPCGAAELYFEPFSGEDDGGKRAV